VDQQTVNVVASIQTKLDRFRRRNLEKAALRSPAKALWGRAMISNTILSAGAMSTITELASIASQMSNLQRHISTGLRVIDPTDDPVAYFTSSSLNARASSLNALLDAINSAQSTVAAANQGISALEALLTTAQGYAIQALASPTSLVTVTGAYGGVLTSPTVISSTSNSSTKFKNGDVVTVSDGTTTATYTAGSADTVQTFLNAINNTAGLKITASLTANGQIQLATTAGVPITIGATLFNGSPLSNIIGLNTGTTNFTTNTTRRSLATQFDALRAQIDAAAQDASYNGVNLIAGGNVSVIVNETGSSKVSITGTSLTSTGLGLAASTNQFQSDADINTALSNITNALASVQNAENSFGMYSKVISTRLNFNAGLVDLLNKGANDLVAADTNADGAALLALQTRQQLAINVLAIATGQNSAVLKLFS
jgi:flagellin-like hook-associated protein FlgL